MSKKTKLIWIIIFLVIGPIFLGKLLVDNIKLWPFILPYFGWLISAYLSKNKIIFTASVSTLSALLIYVWVYILILEFYHVKILDSDNHLIKVINLIIMMTLFFMSIRAYKYFEIFTNDIKNFFSSMKILKSVFSFVVSYLILISFYALIYASIFIFLGKNSFHSIRNIEFLDFFYYSVVTATTLGYGDIVPQQPVSIIISMSEVLFAVIIIGLYLGAVISSFSKTDKIDNVK